MTIKLKLFTITILPTITIIIFSIHHLLDKYDIYQRHNLLLFSSKFLNNTAVALYELQLERGLSSNYIYNTGNDKLHFKDLLLKQQQDTDIVITNFDTFLNDLNKNSSVIANQKFIDKVNTLLKSITEIRTNIINNKLTSDESMSYFSNTISQLIELAESIKFYSGDIHIQSDIMILKKLLLLQELCGQERVLVTLLNNKKVLPKDLDELNNLWEFQHIIYENIKIILNDSSIQIDLMHTKIENYNPYISSIRNLIKNSIGNELSIDNKLWFNIATHRIDDYYILSEEIIKHLEKNIKSKNSQLFNSLLYQIFFTMLTIITLLLGTYLIARNINKSLKQLNAGIENFFDFLNFKSDTPQKIVTNSNDELSIMAKKINKQINYLQLNLENDQNFINETTYIVTLMRDGDFSEKSYFKPSNPNLIELKLVFNELIELILNKIAQQTKSLENLNKTLEDKVYHQTAELEKQIIAITHARDKAIKAEKSKDDFLANMSHEIRTPLNAILGFVTILKKQLSEEKHLNYLNIIDSSGKSLLAIINDILDFSKIKSGKFTITPHEIDPMKEFSNTTLLFAAQAYEKHIIYAVYIDPNLPKTIAMDSTRVTQILSNLLSNAVKFTSRDGVIKVRVLIENETLIISVQDSGIGISKEHITKVFSAFEQADSSTTRKYGGTGLGLSISAKLAELMNGKLSVTSKKGSGSTFTLKLPIKTINTSPKELLDLNKVIKYKFAVLNNSQENEIFVRVIKKYLLDLGITNVVKLNKYQKNGYDILFFIPSDDYNDEIVEAEIPAIAMLRSNFVKLALIPHITSLYAPFAPVSVIQAIDDITVENIQDISKIKTINEDIQINNEVQFIGHVLVAEDNKTNQMLISIILDDYGIDYKIANNGMEAVDMFKEYKFDLVLMDENMPELNGLGAMKQIKEYEMKHSLEKTPIVALTANALTTDIERFLNAGMDGFVAKPINTKYLEQELKKYLKRI